MSGAFLRTERTGGGWLWARACTGCCIHPSLNLVATASGERNFDLWEQEEAEQAEGAERVVAQPAMRVGEEESTAAPQRAASVNSLRIWRFAYRLQSAAGADHDHDAAMTEQQ